MSLTPKEIPTGAVRYNTDSNKMEVYIGSAWMEVAVSTPNLDGGARGLIMGGYSPGSGDAESRVNVIESVVISTFGNSVDFGDLTVRRSDSGSGASRTRGVCTGGFGSGFSPNYGNLIDYVTIAQQGNALDFGDLTNNRTAFAALSNQTRMVIGNGSVLAVPHANTTMDFITIASTGNAVDFGDSTNTSRGKHTTGSATRGLFAGGHSATNVIDFIQIHTTGDAVDFGDLSGNAAFGECGYGNGVRGVLSSGSGSPNYLISALTFVNIPTTGNSSDYGELTTTKQVATSFSNKTRGLHCASGYPANSTQIDASSIQTGGKAVDFGDYQAANMLSAAMGTSNDHGGL